MLTTALQTQENQSSDYYSVVAKGPMLDRVYSMRYRSYSAEGYIEENSSLKFIDEYDNKPNSTCFLLHHQNKAIGSMRTCVFDSKERLAVPVMEVFDEELRNNIGYDNTFVEVNKFVIDPTFQRKGGVEARMLLVGTVVEEAIRRGSASIVLAVRPAHIRFYKMLGCNPISDIKSYPHLSFKTVLMACTDIQWSRDFIRSKVNVVERHDDPVLNYGSY
ncbi:GNAT family N-acetyltransferase [Cellvibrio sp. NN19]|uniref:GNAT family N-acetyltransferase n=1 Tax=Cellvibrio chitinivorans TaxID=3102792 RepID=UPI002B4180D9|nr:GNAT family N-acetyltransferase [Cellvibrio sp. NN19]